MIKWKGVIITISLFILLIYPENISTKPSAQNQPSISKVIKKARLDFSIGLEITNDSDFEVYYFEGNGSENNPYIIKDYIFDYNFYTGIAISNTRKFFEITNCSFLYNEVAIDIWNASYFVVTNNSINYCSLGIALNNVSNVDISLNVLQNIGERAIIIFNSPGTFVEHNIIDYSYFMGIELRNSSFSIINNNSLFHANEGIALFDSEGANVINNIFTKGGITLHSTNHKLEHYLSYNLENNTLNSRKIGFFKNERERVFSEDSYSQLILVNCSEIEISDLNFTNCITGLIAYYGEDIEVHNNVFTKNFEGSIIMFFVEGSQIYSNHLYDNTLYPGGILLYGCLECGVSNNIIDDSERGIMFKHTDKCVASDNECTRDYEAGILLDNANQSLIQNNICKETRRLDSSGIKVTDSYNCDFISNTISQNQAYGIGLYSSEFIQIRENSITENKKYGIFLDEYSSNNIIYWNEAINNALEDTEAESQAADNGKNNTWYSVEYTEGNYWNEHKSKKPYNIDGEAKTKDLYPLRKSPLETEFSLSSLMILIVYAIITILGRKRKQRKEANS